MAADKKKKVATLERRLKHLRRVVQEARNRGEEPLSWDLAEIAALGWALEVLTPMAESGGAAFTQS